MLHRLESLLGNAAARASSVRPESVIGAPLSVSSTATALEQDEMSKAPLGVLDRVYANSPIDMADIEVIGFDFDHTMVSYKKELNRRIYQLALEHLLSPWHGYPSGLAEYCTGYDHRSIIRGLAVDRETGTLVKLSMSNKIVKARRGHSWLSSDEIGALFGVAGALPMSVRDSRLLPLNDLYALATGSLLSDVVEYFERHERGYEPRCVVGDVMGAVGRVHTSYAIHEEVLASLPGTSLVEPAPGLRDVLLTLRAAGKSLFIVSNSPLWYLAPQMDRFVGADWKELFEAVVCEARKPAWFDEAHKVPLRRVRADGSLCPRAVHTLEPATPYAHGSVDELMGLARWASGRKVLYVGDHIFADLVEARRSRHNWVTAAVIAEVRAEMLRANTAEHRERVFRNHCLHAALQLTQEALPTTPAASPRDDMCDDKAAIDQLDAERRRGLLAVSAHMNAEWGSVFHADEEEHGTRTLSLFGFSLRRHCDLYMSELQNIAHYAARQHRFVPQPIGMPHEVRPYVDPVVEQLAGSRLVGS